MLFISFHLSFLLLELIQHRGNFMIAIEKVLIDRREKPLDASCTPELSFYLKEGSEGAIFSYKYILAEDSEFKNVVFESKDIQFTREFSIEYEGEALSHRHEYFLRFILQTEHGEIAKDTSFITRLAKTDWKGTWIGAPQTWNGGALGLRKELPSFSGKKIKKALAYLAGIGYSELYLNGKKLSDELLGPGVTSYDKKVLYRTYDVTDLLNGENDAFGILLGYGWYGKRVAKFQLYVTFEDGSEFETHSFSNENWWFCPTPILNNSIYSGETYDARKEKDYLGGFSNPELRGGYFYKWFGGIHSGNLLSNLEPQEIDPIRPLGEYEGERIKTFSSNNFVYDIHQNIAGVSSIIVKGEAGAKIILRHAETLKEDGHIDQTNLRSADQEDIYILKGEGEESYMPRFTYHGFRYVEVWIEGKANLISLKGVHIHTDTRKIGEFCCSDKDLNRLHHMAVITEENNQHSIPTDCPQRDERFGWLNDLSTRFFQTVYNFDMSRFFRKFIADINDVQDEEGRIADTIPYYTGGRPADTTSVSYLLMAELAYVNYGDKRIVKDNYEHLKRWVEFLLAHQNGYIMDYAYYADWVSCVNYSDAASDPIQISSYFLYWHLKCLAHLASIIDKKEDAKHYELLAKESKDALNEKYFHDGYYGSNVQTENSMALSLGICEKENEEEVYKHLKDSIIAHNNHLTSGNQGYRHTMHLLCEHGDIDLLLDVLKNREYPGWGFMLANDATTVWERWEKENTATMNSFDHPMFGSYDAIFYRYILGIKIDDIYENEIRIEPKIPSSLEFAEGSLDTVRGKIKVKWKKENGKITYNIAVPLSMKVKLTLPNEDSVLLSEGYYRFIR